METREIATTGEIEYPKNFPPALKIKRLEMEYLGPGSDPCIEYSNDKLL